MKKLALIALLISGIANASEMKITNPTRITGYGKLTPSGPYEAQKMAESDMWFKAIQFCNGNRAINVSGTRFISAHMACGYCDPDMKIPTIGFWAAATFDCEK